MDTKTGEIRYFREGEPVPAGYTPLTKREHGILSRRKQKDRVKLLKQIRARMIRNAKRANGGRRLDDAEMKAYVTKARLLVGVK